MKFNSLFFIFVFLPIVAIAFRLFRRRKSALLFMTIASYVFYAVPARWYTLLMALSTTVDFTVGVLLEREVRSSRRKLILCLSLAFNLGMLSFFKYYGFFIDSVNSIAGHELLRKALKIMLPAGISFYTFQSMGYSIDVYRRDIKACRSFIQFASFVSLFPQLIAGPIVRPKWLLPQLGKEGPVDNSRVADGAFLFTCGLAKKVLLADRLAHFADPILNRPGAQLTRTLWVGIIAFALQIYFDFSGYTDMARGLARILGLEFSINFDSPYHADSPSDFWKRWHVSLSSWLRDYLYIPLGGNRKGKTRTSVNLMLTMLLGGLWHGAGLNFILWGAFHGLLLLVFHALAGSYDRLWKWAKHAVMIPLLIVSWIPFRMHNLADISRYFRPSHAGSPPAIPWQLWAFMGLGIAICALPKNSNRIAWGELSWKQAVALAVITVVAILHLKLSSRFIYFAF
jgi:alginate O-acetyltransferase complex protein AlgI